MKDVILDTLLDGVKLLPFLFIAFLIIELIEHKLSNKSKKIISSSGKFGPVLGGLLGAVPQCGFSVMATNLYVTRIISLGTLISIYLSTSDEMIPILLSENIGINIVLKIVGLKIIIGIIMGFIIDYILRNTKKEKQNYELCDEDHCDCEHHLFISTIKHTLKTLLFIMLISFILNVLLHYVGEDYLAQIFLRNSIFGPFVTSLVGLIPNCGASVMITELYINNAISFGSTMSGLLTGSGVALLVLLKQNKNVKENIKIVLMIYFIGVIFGVLLDLFKVIL